MTANTYRYAGKTVLVTGAGSGIGKAIAKGFADNGANLVVLGRRADAIAGTIADVPAERSLAIAADLTDRSQVTDAVARIVERFGRLDVVVANAAAYTSGELTDADDETFRRVFATNVDGLYYLVTASIEHLIAAGGNVVAISSVSGLAGDWGQSVYNSSKHAVNGLIRSLALDYGDRGVRFNMVSPAFTLTENTAHMADDEAVLAPFVNRIALGRPGRPEDVVGPVLFVASDDAAYMTGSNVIVDGGTSASTGQPHQD